MKVYNSIKHFFIFVFLCTLSLIMVKPLTVSAESIEFKIDVNGVLTKYNGIGGNVVIPDYVTAIGDKAFAGKSEIGSVILSTSVTKIESSAFQGCGNLKEVVFTNSLKEIDDFAFKDCSSLSKVVFPKSLEKIGFAAFCNCKSLDDIYLPDNIKQIDRYAFGYYYLNEYVKIPDFVIFYKSNKIVRAYAAEFDLPCVTVKNLDVNLLNAKKASSAKINMRWKRNTYVDTYELQYTTKSNFSKVKKIKISKDKNLFSQKLSRLKKGNTYYIRVRGIRNVAGTTYTSEWSKTKKVKL